MIPKVIHYCWFGQKPLPELALKCIASWKKFLPEYEIKEWNESNFDVNQIPYTAQAYKCGKFAFVSDYARFKIIYEHGGIYFDTDVEIIKPINDIIAKGAFFGIEAARWKKFYNPGLGFACSPNEILCKDMVDFYKNQQFILANGHYNLSTVVQIFSKIIKSKGFRPSSKPTEFQGIFFYPPEYFCPINYYTGQKKITENSRTIHHYAASWVNKYDNLSLIGKLWHFFRLPNTDICKKMLKIISER